MTVAPNGNILAVNGGDGFIVEFNAHGNQIAKKLIDYRDTFGKVGASAKCPGIVPVC